MASINDVIDWLTLHWKDVAAYFTIGTSSGIAGKSLIDKKQNAEISEIKDRVGKLEGNVKELDSKIENNTLLDMKLREELLEHREQINVLFEDIKKDVRMLTSHLLSK